MDKIFIRVVIICLGLSCFSGAKGQDHVLQAGDHLPDMEIKNVWNYDKKSIRLSDYRGKLILLDFWTAKCISCLESFPYMDSLQKKFTDKVQVILINHITPDSTGRFFKKMKRVFKPGIPMISSDTLFHRWFPHEGVPYHIWIDEEGKVLYKTEPLYTTYENVEKITRHEVINVRNNVKKIYRYSLLDNRWEDLPESYSCISRWRHGLHVDGGEREGYESISQVGTIDKLYKYAWDGLTNQLNYFSRCPGVCIVETKNPDRYFRNVQDANDWQEKNYYDYQMWIPKARNKNKYEIMKEDLDRCFGVKTWIEKRPVSCYVLVAMDKVGTLKSKGGEYIYKWKVNVTSEDADSTICLQNAPVKQLIRKLKGYSEYIWGHPFIDRTGLDENIDIRFSEAALRSMEAMRKELNKYGLDIIEEKLEMDVLVISDL